MKRFALIGHPVSGSLSPVLIAAAYGGRFPYELEDHPSFDDAWSRFLAVYDGVNVTAPFKQDAFRRCHHLSDNALRSGAVNLVLHSGGQFLGYNTDVDGVLGALQESPAVKALLSAPAKPAKALVIGTGGAARAAVTAALRMGFSVTVAGRSLPKAEALGCPAIPLDQTETLHPEVVIYTLPASAASAADGRPVIPGVSGKLLRDAIVLEAEYRHPVLSGVPCRAYLSGRRWLFWQAVAGYRLFTGEEPDQEAMELALSQARV